MSPGHPSAFRPGVGIVLSRPCDHFYTHLVEGETLNHDSFLGILPDGQRALGLQQVVNLFIVHLKQGTCCKAEVQFPSSEQGEELCTPGSHTTWCPSQHHLRDLVTLGAADSAQEGFTGNHCATASLKPFQPGSPNCCEDHSKEEKIPQFQTEETSSTSSLNQVAELASS